MMEFLSFHGLHSDSLMGKHRLMYVTIKSATTDLKPFIFVVG